MQTIEFKSTEAKKTPAPRIAETKEDIYWKSFKSINEGKLSGPINHISFSPVAPYHFAVTSGTNVVFYSGETRQKIKSFSRFQDIAYSGNFRKDGKMLTAGDEKGNIKVFEVENKTMLRQAQPHSSAVHAVDFLDNMTLLSGSDDQTLALFDIPSDMVVNTYKGHTDYIRSVSTGYKDSNSSDVFVSGSFDHSIKVWDKRLDPETACIMTMMTDAPVSCILQMNTSLILAAADNMIYRYDMLGNGKLLDKLVFHQKSISCLSYYHSSPYDMSRVVSSSLDGTVKIIDPSAFKVVHSFKFLDPVLSVAISPSNVFAMGSSTGILSTRKKTEIASNDAKQPAIPVGVLLSRVPTARSKRIKEETAMKRVDVEAEKRVKLSKWDYHFKKFEYKKALDSVLLSRKVPEIIGVLEELRAREAIPIAVQGRNDKELEPIISFVAYHLSDPVYTSLMVNVGNCILDAYSEAIGQNTGMDSQIIKLRDSLQREIQLQQDVFSVMGMLDSIVENAES